MPLSSNGLCDAEITTPRSYGPVRVKYAIAGVGTTPALVTSPPWLTTPCASDASIQAPDSRVSRPTSNFAALRRSGSARTSAAPSRAIVIGSSGYVPATPRTPSVPNRRGASTLASLVSFGSVFGTGNPYLNVGRLDVRDARF